MVTVTEHRPPTPKLPTQADLDRMTPGDRLAYAAAVEEAIRRGLLPDGTVVAKTIGPQTDEDLLDGVQELTGHRIPRAAVCEGHTSPAQTFCDLYFERVYNVLWIGNRGGGKTANSGHLHGAKNRWMPGYSSAIAGAVERQGYRAYAEFRKFTRTLGEEIVSSLLSKTVWANGSETEVLGGTVRQLNGPHPNLAQMDEVELSSMEAFEEFLNMAQGNERYAGQQLLTSTRKKAHGIVQEIVKECLAAVRAGDAPPWEVRIFCVFETMARVDNCRSAPENKDRPEAELCNCDRVKKGTFPDGSVRTFAKVCAGRAYRADGFVHLTDVHKRFKQLSSYTWDAQQECRTPNVEGLVHKWAQTAQSLPVWLPKPEFGPIYRGWDWGGNNPNAVVWFQLTRVPVGLNADGLPILDGEEEAVWLIPEGTLVQFDEIYKTSDELPGDGGYSDLAETVARREVQWRSYGFPMEIEMDCCDPAGFIAKREVKKRYRELQSMTDDDGERLFPGIQIPRFKSVPAPVMESVRIHISWGESGKIRIVESMCPSTSDEYDVYHWPDKRANSNVKEEPVKEDDHAMDATRYLIWNLERTQAQGKTEPPSAAEKQQDRVQTRGPFEEGVSVLPTQTPNPTAPVGTDGRRSFREQSVPGVRQQLAGRRSFR